MLCYWLQSSCKSSYELNISLKDTLKLTYEYKGIFLGSLSLAMKVRTWDLRKGKKWGASLYTLARGPQRP